MNQGSRRVLHAISSMGGGGAERQLTYLARGLRESGWEVDVALLSGGTNLERLESSGARIHCIRAKGNYDPSILFRLGKLISQCAPSIVQTWLPQMDVACGLASWGSGVPWILTERSSALSYENGIKSLLRDFAAKRASAIVCNSRVGEAYWRARVNDDSRVVVIPNAIPLSEIDSTPPVRAEISGVPPGEKIVLYVGQLSSGKNVLTLVEALGRVFSRGPGMAILCGEGSARDALEERIGKLGMGARIRLAGFVDPVWGWMKRADVFAFPSLFEGQPNSVLEAMACGCRLVVSEIGAHREILDDQSAILVNPHDVVEIADAIERALSDPSPTHRAEARRRSEGYSLQSCTRRYLECYETALGSSSTVSH